MLCIVADARPLKGRRLTDGPTYAACLPFKLVPLDGLTALYHRASGATNLLAEPMPQILAALGGDRLTIDALMTALIAQHDIATDLHARAALVARLEELSALGIVLPS